MIEKGGTMNAPYSEGPLDTKITFIGEAPGADEERAHRPFVGRSGQELDQLLHSVGIVRSACRFENVVQERPARNDISPFIKFTPTKVKTSEAYDRYVQELKERLEATSSNVFVPLGNVPLYALTGLTNVTKRRGSILSSTLLPGRKVIPTIHPAAILRQYIFRYFVAYDLARIADQADFPEIRLLNRNLVTTPSFFDVMGYIEECHKQSLIAIDIECKGNEVSHISLSTEPKSSICIPFINGPEDYFTPDQEAQVWIALAKLLEDPNVSKVGHNITFDATFLFMKYGIRVSPMEDTMIGFALAYPDFPKGLDFVTSFYCHGEPYYKDDGKKWYKNPFGDEESFRLYNAKDSAVCIEAFSGIMRDLERLNNIAAYKRQCKLIEPLVYMQAKGIKIDVQAMRKASREAEVRIAELQQELVDYVGFDLNPNSPKQLGDYFYGKIGASPYLKDGSPTTDDMAMKRLARKGYKEADLIREIRKLRKLKGTYFDMDIDYDGRLRCSYNPVGTKQGRISSSQTIFGTGGNLQNQPPAMKRMMQADIGYIIFSFDLSQAENRVVAFIANEFKMIEAFETGIDIHKQTASLIFNKPVNEISDEPGSCAIGGGIYSERFWGKKANHGLNYDLGYKTFALYYEIPERDAKIIVESYHRAYPGIRQWHRTIKEALNRDRTLSNILGRNYMFMERWGDELFKQAYSYIPQSSVAEWLNNQGVAPLYYDTKTFGQVELLNQIHDSVIGQIPLNIGIMKIALILFEIKKLLEKPLCWKGRDFFIPADLEVGFNLDKEDKEHNLAIKSKNMPNAEAIARSLRESFDLEARRRK